MRLVQLAVGFGISALAIIVLLRTVSLEKVGEALRDAQPLPMGLIVLCVLGSLVTRAARWQVYFLPRRRVPFKPLLTTLAISYMASTFLPLRAGELVRPVFLAVRERVPFPASVGTILMEKLFDFLAIGVMLALLVTLTPLPPIAQAAGLSIATVILVGFGFVVALAVFRRPTLALVAAIEARLPFELGKRLQLTAAARHFAEGTDSLREPWLWVLSLAWTVATWIFAIGTTLGGTLSLGVQPGIAALLFVVVLTSSGQAVPSSPGYVGVYQLAATIALKAFGVGDAAAFGISLVTWAVTYGSLVVVGLIALWTGGYTFSDVLKSVRSRQAVGSATVSAEPG